MRYLLVLLVAMISGCAAIDRSSVASEAPIGSNLGAGGSMLSLSHHPESCVTDPGGIDWLCRAQEEHRCVVHCDYDETTGELDCNTLAYLSCLIDIDLRCPDIPPTVEETRCGDCRVLPTHWTTCSHSDGRSLTFSCSESVKNAYEERGFSCGPCEIRNPPGEYRSCRCGDSIWREYCPQETVAEPPFEPECDLNPENCVVAEPPPPPTACELNPEFCVLPD